ncbi:MAG TPA: NHL repeat-containing protein [Solirubrobacterales bacterium]|nr:NHL repeat-containing protein [Solirubrobacterales bacterium]
MLIRRLALCLAALAALPGTALAAGGSATSTPFIPAGSRAGTVDGTVPLRGMSVVLMQATPGAKSPTRLGSARSGRGGAFTIHYRGDKSTSVKYLLATRPGGAAEAGFPVDGQSYRLGLALGEGGISPTVKVTERTTVAMGFAMAQFIGAGDRVAGPNPGLRNAAAMSGDLVAGPGGLGRVLRTFPNGGSTSTLPTFDSLANLLTICRHQDLGCARLLRKAAAPGGGPAPDTLAAVANIARYPWHDVAGLYKLSLAARHRRGTWQPSLGNGDKPDAWTLALRFEGNPPGMDGPGNFAIDGEGNIWVGNNYAYSRQSRKPACGGDKVFRFTPTGQTYPGSPYEGGGLSGVGFGVAIDPSNRVWLANFGFEGKGCETEANHYSVSAFSLSGKVLSPPRGWEVGGINWPQGTVSDRRGNIWLANCGNNSVTEIPGGDPAAAVNFGEAGITAGSTVGFSRPFGAALNAQGDLFVTGNSSDSVLELSPSGKPLSLATGGGLHLPLGIAVDDNGYMWVGNSTWVIAPCPGSPPVSGPGKGGGDVTLIKPDGKIAPGNPIRGAGLKNPWGVAVDGDDQVWVANFSGRRLSELCGTEPRNCPPGHRRVGAAISPKSGYGFDGLVRNTGVAIDPSGNVWLANNWKVASIQTNPGGYQIVAYLGLAAPVKSPQIGPPQRP